MLPPPRRLRVFVLAALLLAVISWYYLDLDLELDLPLLRDRLPLHGGKSHPSASSSPSSSFSASPSTSPSPSPSPTEPPGASISLEPSSSAPTTASSTLPFTSPSDVLLIFKTGASTFWRRMPLHLTTTLSNSRVPNYVIYSDLAEQLALDVESVDVLANVSDILRTWDASAHASYQDLHSSHHLNTYREHALLPGDEPQSTLAGNPPGWLLDKYKFLPMLTHAQKNWPAVKWYVYIEDDTFIFWDNVLRWLSTLSPDDEPEYWGAYSGEGNATFAQGGSGIVFSRSLMRSVFAGPNPPDLVRYGNYSASACCGDIILGQVLRDHGVFVNRGDYGPVSFRPEPPWKTGFDKLMWCAPVFSFHHLHQRDLVQLSLLERAHTSTQRPILFRDIFTALIAPSLHTPQLSHWDNFASRYLLGASHPSTSSLPAELHPLNPSAGDSPPACRAACLALPLCLSWRHDSNAAQCALDTVVRLGRERDPLPAWAPPTEIVSGWMLERIDEELGRDECTVVSEP